MSHPDPTRPEHEHEEHEDQDQDPQLNEEDIVEVHEDDDDTMMDEDDDDDEDNSKYDGEIVIGAPMPGEEEELAAMEAMHEDNTLGATCT